MYSNKDKFWDAVTCIVGAAVFYVMIYIAFGLDVITTGM